jgi:hypothetical protein
MHSSDHRQIQQIRVLKNFRGHGCQSYHGSRPLIRKLDVYIPKKHSVRFREIMRKLLRNSCGSLSLRQAALIDDSESSVHGSFRCIAGKCCLALRPVVFLYPTSSRHCPPDIRKHRALLLDGFFSSSTGGWAHIVEQKYGSLSRSYPQRVSDFELIRAQHCGWWLCLRIRVLNIVSMNTLPRRRIRKCAADLRRPVAYKVYERGRQDGCVRRTQLSCSVACLSRSYKYKGVRKGEGERGKSGYEGNGYC